MKRALITGITGQDGSYLAEYLLERGYRVDGLIRRSSQFHTGRIDHLYENPELEGRFHLHYGDLADGFGLHRLLEKVEPDEIYHLGAMSHVKVSFEIPEFTAEVDGLGTLRLLEALRVTELPARFYQASTSELYGSSPASIQDEETPFAPTSPYAIAKLYAHWTTINYREAYGIFASNGILFNHESPRRGPTFVTRKIVQGVASIVAGSPKPLLLGNLNARRDWGDARDYVRGMWQILQHREPDDFVLATGKSVTVRRFAELAFAAGGITLVWEGEGIEEVGRSLESGEICVTLSSRYFRLTEVDSLCGCADKARRLLGWEPTHSLEELVQWMVEEECRAYQQGEVGALL